MEQFQEEDYSKRLDFGLWKTLFKFMGSVKKEVFLITLFNVLYSLVTTLIPQANRFAIDNFVVSRDLSGFTPSILITSRYIPLRS